MPLMHTFINSPFKIGSVTLPHRLLQGPLAGYSCAPFRTLFNQFKPPAYAVSEMSSAVDVLGKHGPQSRYLYRSPEEQLLAYQLSGNNKDILAQAAVILQDMGADLIDINCGCPKTKIRKKGAGSALLEDPIRLIEIIRSVRAQISIPLTIKIRLQGTSNDVLLAQMIEEAGADALIVHGRRWIDDYDKACDYLQIGKIKNAVSIPVIANGDISDLNSLTKAWELSACDGFMIARAGCGKPWLYQELLERRDLNVSFSRRVELFMTHLHGLSTLEDEFKAVLQSRSLIRYYFRNCFDAQELEAFYTLKSLATIEKLLGQGPTYSQ